MIYAEQRGPYQCPICRKWWQPLEQPMSCAVNHAPGTCCHYRERELAPPQEGD